VNEIPTLITARLILRRLAGADAVTLHRIYQNDGVLRYFPVTVPPRLDRVESFIAGQQKHWEKFGYGNWGIMPEGQQEIIGWVGLQYLPELDETEVGFLLDKPFWGKGYATEAALASLNFGFKHFPFDHLIALVHAENLASRRVIKKCAMIYVDTLPLWGIELLRYRKDRST
jgi:ribosomal-protein-alanine N-acetyltransferase